LKDTRNILFLLVSFIVHLGKENFGPQKIFMRM